MIPSHRKFHIKLLPIALLLLCCMVGPVLCQRVSPASAKRPTMSHWSNKRGAAPTPASKSSEELLSNVTPDKFNRHFERSLLKFTDGTTIEVDDAWVDAQGIWYRRGGVTNLLERVRVRAIERAQPQVSSEAAASKKSAGSAVLDAKVMQADEVVQPVWIYLVGGARVEADSVTETAGGAWYRRGTLSIFLASERIERIEREPSKTTTDATLARSGKERGWTTGHANIDAFIRASGAQHGVDPYLIFCVMEQESHFNVHALSPKGARGLMQLMPGTAARFGVRHSFDPQQNIMGGTRYLKELLQQFDGRVDLVLASYNAGEGAVIKYGHNVPPYRETRDYVKKISARYGQNKHVFEDAKATTPPAVPARKR